MKPNNKVIDTFQIVGFVISIAISMSLIVLHQDTVASVTLGLILATLTQLFDLQIRNNATETKLLEASAIDRQLYEYPWLLKYIQQIVSDYVQINNRNYQLFIRRANEDVIDCRNTLHEMSEGHLTVVPNGPFFFGATFSSAEHSIKQSVTQTNPSYFHNRTYKTVLDGYSDISHRGVKFEKIFIAPLEKLREILDVLEYHQKVGINIYVAFPEDVANEWKGDYVIVDDIALAKQKFSEGGEYLGQDVSINDVEIERMIRMFNNAKLRARCLDDARQILESQKE